MWKKAARGSCEPPRKRSTANDGIPCCARNIADDRPIKAEFYAVSGRLLKTSRYEDFRELAGRLRPTRIVLEDALKAGESSVLEYSSMELRDLPERMFTREYLRRLQ